MNSEFLSVISLENGAKVIIFQERTKKLAKNFVVWYVFCTFAPAFQKSGA
jgi:hypothetical protein